MTRTISRQTEVVMSVVFHIFRRRRRRIAIVCWAVRWFVEAGFVAFGELREAGLGEGCGLLVPASRLLGVAAGSDMRRLGPRFNLRLKLKQNMRKVITP